MHKMMYYSAYTINTLCIETTREFTRLPDEIYYYNTWAVVHNNMIVLLLLLIMLVYHVQ